MQVHSGKTFDPDDPEHMQWVYSEVDLCSLLSPFLVLGRMLHFSCFLSQSSTSLIMCFRLLREQSSLEFRELPIL